MTDLVFHVGQDVPLWGYPTDHTSAPADGTVTVAVTDPTGAPVSNVTVPIRAAQGQYTAVVPAAALSGQYLVKWTCVGAGNSFTWVDETEFTVIVPSALHIVDIASVRAHCSMTNRVNDDELLPFILAADEQARYFCGPVAIEQHTEWHTGGRPAIAVNNSPLKSVVSVTEYYGLSAFPLTEQPLGSQSTAFGYTVNYDTETIVRRSYGGDAAVFAYGMNNIKIVYTAGLGSVPHGIRLGALELIRFWWDRMKQASGGGKARNPLEGESAIPMGFAMPDFVVEMWAPWRRAPGIA